MDGDILWLPDATGIFPQAAPGGGLPVPANWGFLEDAYTGFPHGQIIALLNFYNLQPVVAPIGGFTAPHITASSIDREILRDYLCRL